MNNVIEVSTKEKARSVISSLERLINHHESMKNSYFWNAPTLARERRSYEVGNSRSLIFNFQGMVVNLKCSTDCSAKNIYYHSEFFVDNEKTTLRTVRKILEELKSYAEES